MGIFVSTFFIISDKPQGSAFVDTSLTFKISGSQVGSYSHTVSSSSDFLYNQRVFSQNGLRNGEHTLEVSANADNGGGSTTVLFDYFVYKKDQNY